MQALKAVMKVGNERRPYGREYDLDLFQHRCSGMISYGRNGE